MTFSKRFPRPVEGSNYPEWVEVFLDGQEEKIVDEECRQENIKLMKECISDAEYVAKDKNLKPFQTNIIDMAISLFEKRASHSIYWKESKAKEKFDNKN
ncbi:MAG: hypothetical protein KAQ83_03160 [Nanoarchaeota archaeon]|nr:hypothetical protein [Nanoarchaeota archaeon]